MASKLLIVAYHQVHRAPDPMRPGEVDAASFAAQMRVLARFFNVLPLGDAVSRLGEGTLPTRAVSITFDDGYADNYAVAWPVLRELGLPATLFVATGYLDGGRMWNDTIIEAVRRYPGDVLELETLGLGRHAVSSPAERYAASRQIVGTLKYERPDKRQRVTNEVAARAGRPLPDDLMLTAGQVRELADGGIDIGGHTTTHPILTTLDDPDARREIIGGKEELESIVDGRVRNFAYPNGRPGTDYDDRHVSMVMDAGFDCAVATRQGVALGDDDSYQLPRFGPWRESGMRFGLRLARMFLTS